MQDTKFYEAILGLRGPWTVRTVDLDICNSRVEIEVFYSDSTGTCSDCGSRCSLYDKRAERRWRHLDTCQMQTYIKSCVPRVKCGVHGVQTIAVPWAESSSRLTMLFERLAIELLLATKNQSKTASLLGVSFDSIHHVMERAVERGLSRRDMERAISAVGIDEKSYGKGQQYMSVLSDSERRCVLEVEQERSQSAAERLLQRGLSESQRVGVKAVSVDMWQAYSSAIAEVLSDADVVYDRFHLQRYLQLAVDAVRRTESAALGSGKGQNPLKGSKYLFLKNPENHNQKQRSRFAELQQMNLQTSDAWRMKENFRGFFACADLDEATTFFEQWIANVESSDSQPMKSVARMFVRHKTGILNYIKHRISNGIAEGINSMIQQIKHTARGFRLFAGYRTAILFFLGKLDLLPHKSL